MPRAAMVIEADFVVSEILGQRAGRHAGYRGGGGQGVHDRLAQAPCYDFFPFPAPAGDQANNGAIQGTGDVAVLIHPTPQAKAFIRYLASPEPGEILVSPGRVALPQPGGTRR